MKSALFKLLYLLFGALLLITACRCQIENDAAQLADIQLRRTEVILHMLKSSDSLEISQCLRQIKLLDLEFSQLKQTFDNKYADSAARVQFEKAYSNAMKKN